MNTKIESSADVASVLSTPNEFLLWLESKPSDAPVGDELHMLKCPISEYLREKYSVEVFMGNKWDNSTLRLVGDKEVEAPGWAQWFMSAMSDGDASEAVPIPHCEANGFTTTEGCEPGDLYARCDTKPTTESGEREWYRDVAYKPVAGKCVSLVRDMITNPEYYEEVYEYVVDGDAAED